MTLKHPSNKKACRELVQEYEDFLPTNFVHDIKILAEQEGKEFGETEIRNTKLGRKNDIEIAQLLNRLGKMRKDLIYKSAPDFQISDIPAHLQPSNI